MKPAPKGSIAINSKLLPYQRAINANRFANRFCQLVKSIPTIIRFILGDFYFRIEVPFFTDQSIYADEPLSVSAHDGYNVRIITEHGVNLLWPAVEGWFRPIVSARVQSRFGGFIAARRASSLHTSRPFAAAKRAACLEFCFMPSFAELRVVVVCTDLPVFFDHWMLEAGSLLGGRFEACFVLVRCQVVEARMRADRVVVSAPGFDHDLGFLWRSEPLHR